VQGGLAVKEHPVAVLHHALHDPANLQLSRQVGATCIIQQGQRNDGLRARRVGAQHIVGAIIDGGAALHAQLQLPYVEARDARREGERVHNDGRHAQLPNVV
jgi:hypothetical protein